MERVSECVVDRVRRMSPWLTGGLPLLLAMLAVTGGSFWIDEFASAQFASPPTLREWWHAMVTTIYAEAQVPFYLLYLWAWVQVFGQSEVSMRLAALPLFVPGVGLFLASIGRVSRWGTALALMIISSPFVWYYLNEARLYAMQIGVTGMVCAAITALSQPEVMTEATKRWWWRALAAGLVLLSALSLLGMIWCTAAVIAAGAMIPDLRRRAWWQMHRLMIAVSVLLLSGLAVYYLRTLLHGARATLVGTTNWETVVFILYELLGFAGLGPGRIELRAQGARALQPYLPMLLAYGALTGAVLTVGLIEIWRRPTRRRAITLAVGLGFPALFLLGVGVVKHFRVLGRHFTPLLPLLLLIGSVGLTALWRRGSGWRAIAAAFVLLAIVSSLQVRFADRHRKDDYKGAARFARAALARGERVWWCAEPSGAAYYGVPMTRGRSESGKALEMANPQADRVRGHSTPDWVIVSKPDVYDVKGTVSAYLDAAGFYRATNLNAFEIWHRSGPFPATGR